MRTPASSISVMMRLRRLLDKHAPSRKIERRSRVLSPWFNAVCRMVKIETRRLEKVYRLTHTIIAYRECRTQSVAQRRIYQTAYSDFWSNAISNCLDTKSLWRKMNLLLQPMESTTDSVDDFSSYFTGKVVTIRASTTGAPPPTIRPRPDPITAMF